MMSILNFVWPFGTFKLAEGHLSYEQDNSYKIAKLRDIKYSVQMSLNHNSSYYI